MPSGMTRAVVQVYILSAPSLLSRSEYRSLALDERHCGTYFLLAILCIEGNQRRYGGERTPPREVNEGLFEGSGGYLSGADVTSYEAKVRCVSSQRGEHRLTISPALAWRGRQQ